MIGWMDGWLNGWMGVWYKLHEFEGEFRALERDY